MFTGLLQANGIIPKPAVSEEVLDLTTDDEVKPEPIGDEIDIAENAARKETAVRSKRSNPGRESAARSVKRIKREKTFDSSDEVIDLT